MILKRTILAALVCIAATTSIFAEAKNHAYRLKGVVTDSLTNAGEPYATLSIVRKGEETKPLKMAVTDADGRFSMDATGDGEYLLIVRSMGRNDIRKAFTVSATSKTIDLGKLLATDSQTELKGVEVVAYKPLVKADIDKLTYSVEDDPEAGVNTVMDMLKKVPMVSVDGQDNVKVNGSSSFKVYVNGKPNNMMTNNPKEVLKSMPAASIKKVEVITNPGPKYDAEGVGGIINIITVGKGPEGYTATFSARGSNTGGGGGVFATVKKGKLTMSMNYNNNFTAGKRQDSTGEQQLLDDSGTPTQITETASSAKPKSQWHGGSMEASYEIDSLRLITASFSLNRYAYKQDSYGSARSYVPAAGGDLYRYSSLNHNKGSFNSISGGLDYQRSFKNVKGRLLTFSYRIETGPNTSKDRLTYSDMYASEAWTDYLRRIKNQNTDGDQSSTEQTFQLDYTTLFAKYHTFETGAKYILRQNKSTNDKYDTANEDNGAPTFDAENSSHFKHHNDILAAYAGYGFAKEKWSARLGLRYEHTLQKVEYLLGRGTDFSKNFDDLVPSAKLGYKFTDMTNLSLSYKMRISRPGIWYLNPYLNDNDPENISQGNSNLDSEKTHSVDLEFGSYGMKLSYSISAGYAFTNNSIQEVRQMVDDRSIEGLRNPMGKQVMYSTYYNIGRTQNVNFNGYVSWNPLTDTRFTLSTWGGYAHMTDGQDMENHGWNMSVWANLQQTIAKTWTLSLSAYKQTPNISLQGTNGAYFSHDISLTKKMLDDRLNITVACSNPFKKYYTFKGDYSGRNFNSSGTYKYYQQSFAISVSYRIGKLQTGVKRTERTIQNDDVMTGGGNTGSTGGNAGGVSNSSPSK